MLWVLAEFWLRSVHRTLEWLTLEETERALRKVEEAQRKLDQARGADENRAISLGGSGLFSTIVGRRSFRNAFLIIFVCNLVCVPSQLMKKISATLADNSEWVLGITSADYAAYNPWRDYPAGQDDVLRESEYYSIDSSARCPSH